MAGNLFELTPQHILSPAMLPETNWAVKSEWVHSVVWLWESPSTNDYPFSMTQGSQRHSVVVVGRTVQCNCN